MRFSSGGCRTKKRRSKAGELGLTSEKTKTLDAPENRDGMESFAGHRVLVSPLLSGQDTKQYRSLTMRAAYLARDSAGHGNCVKNLARRMQRPREVDMQRLKRLVRCSKGKPRYF